MQTLILENYVSPVMFVEATLHEFVSRGRFDPNVEAIQEALHLRRDAMISALAREMPEGTRWNEPDGGYFLWVDLPGGLSAESLLAQADEVGVAFIKGPDFFYDGGGSRRFASRSPTSGPRRSTRGCGSDGSCATPSPSPRDLVLLPDSAPRRPRPLRWRVRHDPNPDPARHRRLRHQRLRGPRGGRAGDRRARRARCGGRSPRGSTRPLGAGPLHRRRGRARRSRRHLDLRPRPGDQARRDGRRARHDRVVVGGTAGKAFEPSPWESWLEALPFYEAKDFDAAAAVLGRADVEHPDNPNVLFNLACCEALAGRREDALGHLRRAAELDPRVREWAASDTDLDSIRDAPKNSNQNEALYRRAALGGVLRRPRLRP